MTILKAGQWPCSIGKKRIEKLISSIYVTEFKLVPLVAQHANKSGDRCWGNKSDFFLKASRPRTWWTPVLKHHLNSGLMAGFLYVREEGQEGVEVGGDNHPQTSGHQQGSCETPWPWLVGSSHLSDMDVAMMFL